MRQSLPRERDQYTASPVATVFARDSRFIQASMSTSPEAASCATAGTRPSAFQAIASR